MADALGRLTRMRRCARIPLVPGSAWHELRRHGELVIACNGSTLVALPDPHLPAIPLLSDPAQEAWIMRVLFDPPAAVPPLGARITAADLRRFTLEPYEPCGDCGTTGRCRRCGGMATHRCECPQCGHRHDGQCPDCDDGCCGRCRGAKERLVPAHYGLAVGHGIDRVLFSQAHLAMDRPPILLLSWIDAQHRDRRMLHGRDPESGAQCLIAGLNDACPGDGIVAIPEPPP